MKWHALQYFRESHDQIPLKLITAQSQSNTAFLFSFSIDCTVGLKSYACILDNLLKTTKFQKDFSNFRYCWNWNNCSKYFCYAWSYLECYCRVSRRFSVWNWLTLCNNKDLIVITILWPILILQRIFRRTCPNGSLPQWVALGYKDHRAKCPTKQLQYWEIFLPGTAGAVTISFSGKRTVRWLVESALTLELQGLLLGSRPWSFSTSRPAFQVNHSFGRPS